MLYHNNEKVVSTKPDHETTKIDFNLSPDSQDNNSSFKKLNDEDASLVKPLLETCLKFGSLILDLMDDYDVDDFIYENCSMSFILED